MRENRQTSCVCRESWKIALWRSRFVRESWRKIGARTRRSFGTAPGQLRERGAELYAEHCTSAWIVGVLSCVRMVYSRSEGMILTAGCTRPSPCLTNPNVRFLCNDVGASGRRIVCLASSTPGYPTFPPRHVIVYLPRASRCQPTKTASAWCIALWAIGKRERVLADGDRRC